MSASTTFSSTEFLQQYPTWHAISQAALRGDRVKVLQLVDRVVTDHQQTVTHCRGTMKIQQDVTADKKPIQEDEITILHRAVENGYFQAVEYLVQLQVAQFLRQEGRQNIDAHDDSRKTLLHLASEAGDVDLVKLLVNKYGANIEAVDRLGRTPLHWASIGNATDVVEFFVKDCGANVEAVDKYKRRTPLHLASFNGCRDAVEVLVKKCQASISATDADGWTPLHFACYYGHIDIMDFLVKKCHTNVDVTDRWGQTPLHLASERNYVKRCH